MQVVEVTLEEAPLFAAQMEEEWGFEAAHSMMMELLDRGEIVVGGGATPAVQYVYLPRSVEEVLNG